MNFKTGEMRTGRYLCWQCKHGQTCNGQSVPASQGHTHFTPSHALLDVVRLPLLKIQSNLQGQSTITALFHRWVERGVKRCYTAHSSWNPRLPIPNKKPPKEDHGARGCSHHYKHSKLAKPRSLALNGDFPQSWGQVWNDSAILEKLFQRVVTLLRREWEYIWSGYE